MRRRGCRAARRMRARAWLAAVAVGMAMAGTPVVTGSLPGAPAPAAHAADVTGSQNALRDGWDPNEPDLSPAVVSGGSFGQLFSTAVDGQVYAQPIVAGSTVVVATENDQVYGLNATTGAINWSLSLGTPWPTSAEGCSDISPNVGVTGTPVYDPSTGTVYMVARIVPAGGSVYHPIAELVGVDAQTGAITETVRISGAPVNDPTRPFNPFTELQRPALLLMNGTVYAAFGSLCDISPYVGMVVGVNVATKSVTMWSDESGLTDDRAGIWQAGGGIMSDGPGRLFVTSGNGVSPAAGPGTSPPSELGDSVIRLGVQSDGTMAAQDFFSPANAPTLDANDLDFGSAPPLGLPFGSSTYPHLLMQAGKDGRIFLLNRDNLGGRGQGPNGTDNPVSSTGPFQGQFNNPAAFGDTSTITPTDTGNDFVYYVGRGDYMRALKFKFNSAGMPALSDAANSTATFGYSSGSPVVTSNGTDPSSAVVWEVYSSGASGAGGMLEAFDAMPQNPCSPTTPGACLRMIWSAPIGTASKFTIPATDNGRVYVGTRDGDVLGFGSPDAAPLDGAPPVSFGSVPVGQTSGAQQVTMTATSDVTVTGVAASPGVFATGQVTVNSGGATSNASFPVALAAGDTITAPVTFAPTAPGGAAGALSFATTYPNFPTVSVSLSGSGAQPGLVASASRLSYYHVPVGVAVPKTVDITNDSTTTYTVSGDTGPSGVFTATGLPAAGAQIAPGQSLPVTVTYKPTQVTTNYNAFTIGFNGGHTTVNLAGYSATDNSAMSASPTSVSFGSVPLGQQSTADLVVTNKGNLTATLSGGGSLDAPFGAPNPVTVGLPVNPGYDLKVPITFTPSSVGAFTAVYKLTWTDVQGTHTLSVPVAGTGAPPAAGAAAVPPPGGGWTLNGSAQTSGTGVALTSAAANQAGSAVYPSAVPSDGVKATFTASIGGGTGGYGMTFAMLDASGAGPRSVGGTGSDLGFGGLPGVAVTLDTSQSSGDVVGIATSGSGGHLAYVASSSNVPNLRSGTHTIGVAVSSGTVTVTVDGTQVLSTAVTLPPTVLLAFTGSTGDLTDAHTVTSAAITASGVQIPPPGGGWSFNGVSGMTGSDTTLTPAVGGKAGTVVYPTPVSTAGLQVTFNAQIGGGTGGDGLTFALLNPASTTGASVGGAGGNLGFGGLSGVAVALATNQEPSFPAANFVGLSDSTNSNDVLSFSQFAKAIPPLRQGTHTVAVKVVASSGGPVLVVTLDGQQVLQQAEPTLTATALLAFTGATGSLTDVHTVRDVAISTAAATPATSWHLNGAAAMSGSDLVLTPASPNRAGSAVYPTAVPGNGVQATFTAEIGGGSGGYGMTFAMLDASSASPTSLGHDGADLGFGGLPGVAVALVTQQSPGDPSANFVGISTGAANGQLTFVATSSDIPNLRKGTHTIWVSVSNGAITVSVDGAQALSAAVTLPPSVLLAFTGGTGNVNDVHEVTSATITAGGAPVTPPAGGLAYSS